MSRYSKEHYEDVARILSAEFATQKPANLHGPIRNLIYDFADLFAADNPPACIEGQCPSHGGFDREQFLAACRLEKVSHGL